MREYMRNNDRAMSNIEALPGGFNALRQLYENVQVGPACAAGPGLSSLLVLGSAAAGAACAGQEELQAV